MASAPREQPASDLGPGRRERGAAHPVDRQLRRLTTGPRGGTSNDENFDYRMSKALEEERFASSHHLRRRPRKEDDRRSRLLGFKRDFGRWLIAFGQRLIADEGRPV